MILTVGPVEVDSFQGVSTALILGEFPFSWIPVISAVIFTAIFITLAIWRFNRQEFQLSRRSIEI
ncbi:MAG: hypothetical protein JSV89_19500 [Spirochaetaceae bacterium]|nr:MAG: hypothetical protein JSV89_19500 [Spirochaetaceae bacterium]